MKRVRLSQDAPFLIGDSYIGFDYAMLIPWSGRFNSSIAYHFHIDPLHNGSASDSGSDGLGSIPGGSTIFILG